MRITCLLLFSLLSVSTALADSARAEKMDLADSSLTKQAAGHTQKYTSDQALQISQSALGQTLGYYQFLAADGTRLSLKDFFGKPLIISLIYTSCYHICPTTTANLHQVVKKARDVLGEDSFNVLTLGFDTDRDTPEAMASFARAQSSGADNWSFLAMDQATSRALSSDLGFIYTASAAGFDHLIQASIIDKHGRVYRQVYGLQPQTPHFIEPLKELVFGEPADDSLLAGLTAKINLFCTVYDPAQDRYIFNYSIFIGLIVGLTLGAIFVYLFYREWRYTANSKS